MFSFHQEGSEQLNNCMKKTHGLSVAIDSGEQGKLTAMIMINLCAQQIKKPLIYEEFYVLTL